MATTQTKPSEERVRPVGVVKAAPTEERVRPTPYLATIIKAERRLVTGVVLVPDDVDAQGDVIDAETIETAAHNFVATYNVAHGIKRKKLLPPKTSIGKMHKDWSKDIDLVESYLAPMDMILGGQAIKVGSWIITVRVKDDGIWEDVKAGKLAGFSIGGTAVAERLT